MHQTTVRFGEDLWAMLEAEAAATGVSAAQYIREATLARLSYTTGRRGHEHFAAEFVDEAERAQEAVDSAATQVDSSAALWAQGRLARKRAQELRNQARQVTTRPGEGHHG